MTPNKIDILAIDIGNTSVYFAYFSGNRLVKDHRVATASLKKASTSKTIQSKFPIKKIKAAVIASVVPWAADLLKRQLVHTCSLRTYIIGKDFEAPIVNRYKKPKQVGIDRLMNAVAAFDRYRRDIFIVDFGTAVTFDIVSKKGEYLGGVIAPGIEITLEALYQKTALLPKIRLAHPRHLIGRDTAESIRVGCSVGIGGMCDSIVQRIATHHHLKPLIIATGGYARFIKRYCSSIDIIDPRLTVKGVLISYKKFLTKNLECI